MTWREAALREAQRLGVILRDGTDDVTRVTPKEAETRLRRLWAIYGDAVVTTANREAGYEAVGPFERL